MASVDRKWRADGIDAVWPQAAAAGAVPADGGPAYRGTTHVSIIDQSGNAVSVTISNGEGNGRIVPGCGFMMNNMLGEEDVNPDGFHNWTPGRRLSSMMTPVIAETDDGALYAVGSGGSNRIRTATFQILSSCLADGLPLQDAVAAPRLHFEKGRLDIECADERSDTGPLCDAFADTVRWPGRSLYFGGTHCVARQPDGAFSGAGDPRREGAFLLA
jgi:gamma-glutamyltranspeptidase/glutathione hydrolase